MPPFACGGPDAVSNLQWQTIRGRERQGQVGAAGLRSVATFGDVDGDARQYEGDQLLGTIVLVWLHMVQGRMVRGGGGTLTADPPYP